VVYLSNCYVLSLALQAIGVVLHWHISVEEVDLSVLPRCLVGSVSTVTNQSLSCLVKLFALDATEVQYINAQDNHVSQICQSHYH
jgi:hypothetical protein